jgi:Flp pilus assembly pilin Flp
MSDQKPTILDNILFFALIAIFVVCTFSLVQSGIVGVFSLIGSCK